MGTDEKDWLRLRKRMVEEQLVTRGIRDRAVLDAMLAVPRERFVDRQFRDSSYCDGPLPIGYGQTISQPYIVAYMCELLEVETHHHVLEIGCGSGYQAAVLGQLARSVVAVERIEPLYDRALSVLKDEIDNGTVRLILGDGTNGVKALAPFDRIIVSAAIQADRPPPALLEQLKPGGILVAPLGTMFQTIRIFHKKEDGIEERQGIAVSFVPFVSDENT